MANTYLIKRSPDLTDKGILLEFNLFILSLGEAYFTEISRERSTLAIFNI